MACYIARNRKAAIAGRVCANGIIAIGLALPDTLPRSRVSRPPGGHPVGTASGAVLDPGTSGLRRLPRRDRFAAPQEIPS